MRGLIKGSEEIPETSWTGFIRTHLELMHTQELASDSVTPSSGEALRTGGNGYALAEDYEAGYEWIITVRDGMLYATRGAPLPSGAGTESPGTEEASASESATVGEETTITIDGRTYTISELSDLVNKQ